MNNLRNLFDGADPMDGLRNLVVENVGTILVDAFIQKLQEDQVDSEDIDSLGIYYDDSLVKQGRYAWYGFIKYKNGNTIGTSVDVKISSMGEFQYDGVGVYIASQIQDRLRRSI